MTDDGKRAREICPVKKGYGMSISAMRPVEGASLYSILDKLHKTVLPTLEMTRTRQSDWQV
jgi:hypothetical protein